MKLAAGILAAIGCLLGSSLLRAAEELVDLAAAAQDAAVKLTNYVDSAEMNGYGAFISENGLAVVNLGSISLGKKPIVVAADGTPLRFGRILGIFPEQELALMQFKHRPRTWLRIAAEEPESGETVALLALDPNDTRDGKVPPVVGPVKSKRSGMTTTSRIYRFVRIFSLAALPTREQRPRLSVGCYVIDRRGELVGFTNGVGPSQIDLVPVDLLADKIEQMIEADEAIPFPLPGDLNPIDTAMLDSAYSAYHQAAQRGDTFAVQQNLEILLERYPESLPIKSSVATETTLFADPLSLFPPPDPGEPAAHQVSQLILRALLLAAKSNDFDGGIVELEKAVKLSPADFSLVRSRLAMLYLYRERFAEAEVILREAYSANPEDIAVARFYQPVLLKLGKAGEAEKIAKQIEKLEEVYGVAETDGSAP